MLSLSNILEMSIPLRMATIATISSLLLVNTTFAQTYTHCNPTQGVCPADPALGNSITADFTAGASSQFTASGTGLTYDKTNGAQFTVSQSGDAPTLTSNWYIMFGRVDVVMKAAPGAGIVSSSVLQSDDLDEIDWEWLGAEAGQVQSNYFGKGQTTTYDRAAVHAVEDTQGQWHTYTTEWTAQQVIWQIDGTTVRVLGVNDANGQYPQTPMQFKLGAWSGGDPANPAGTIAWSQGPTNYASGPYSMYVKSVAVTDYSSGSEYKYGDTSGAWTSIESTGGTVNGRSGASGTEVAAPAITSTAAGNPPSTGTCVWRARCSDGSSAVTPLPSSQQTLVAASGATSGAISNRVLYCLIGALAVVISGVGL